MAAEHDNATTLMGEFHADADDCAPPVPTRGRPPAYFAPRCSMAWLARAAALPGKALHVACALLHLQRLCKSDDVQVRPSMLASFSITRQAAYRGVEALHAAGLIAGLDRARGRAATVRIVADTIARRA
jgi:hypothetical protein